MSSLYTTDMRDMFGTPNPATDLVIRTSDNVRLYATKSILTSHSPYFARRFVNGSLDNWHDFEAKEDCRDMRAILHLCYPPNVAATPYILEAAFWGSLLSALSKYEMDPWALRDMVAASEWPRTQPLMTFVMARRCDWEDIGRMAAWESLRFPLRAQSSVLIPELGLISGLEYHAFIEYHWRCADAACDFLKGGSSIHRDMYSLEIKRPFPESLLASPTEPEPVACTCLEPQRVQCSVCSALSDAVLLFNNSRKDQRYRFMHPWFRPFIQRALTEVERCPRIGLASVLQDDTGCPSQTPEMVQAIVKLLDEELEGVLRSVELEVEGW